MLKKHQVLLILLFLSLSLLIIILLNKSEEPNPINSPVVEEKKTLTPEHKALPEIKTEVKEDIKVKKQEPISLEDLTKLSIENSIHEEKIDFVGETSPLVYPKPTIDHIMKEQEKLNVSAPIQYTEQKEENWEVDYEVQLEEQALEELKTNPNLDHEMIKVKVGFSKSF